MKLRENSANTLKCVYCRTFDLIRQSLHRFMVSRALMRFMDGGIVN